MFTMQKKAIGAAALIAAVLIIILFFTLLNGGNTTKTTSITSTIWIQTSTATYAPSEEIANVSSVDPNATTGSFYCNTSADCIIVHTTSCFNNLASQQACISKTSSGQYASYYSNFISSGSIICPQYIINAYASCSCINNGCSLVYRTG